MQKSGSFAERTLPVHLIRTENSAGVACYFILRAPQAQFVKLMKARTRERVDIADYGDILASGFGEPDEELKTKYGF